MDEPLLADYYRSTFPAGALAWLATRRGDALDQREWAAEGAYYKRYVVGATAGALRKELLMVPQLASVHIGPVYSGRVSRSGKGGGTLEDYSRPHRRELVFDVDLTDFPFLKEQLTPQPGGPVDLEACDRAWPVAGLALFFLKYMLCEHLGFTEFLCVYSGRRGAHLWVLDERAMVLTEEGRAAVASFVNLRAAPSNGVRASGEQRKLMNTYDLTDAVVYSFESVLVEGMGLLDDIGARDAFVAALGLSSHESMHNLADEASRKETGAEAWQYIKAKVESQAKRNAKACGWFVERLQETVLGYVWPRIDLNVTKGLNHLIKAPFVAHPKTQRIAMPIDGQGLLTFRPAEVPTLGTASMAGLAPFGGEAGAQALRGYVVHQQPTPAHAPPQQQQQPSARPPSTKRKAPPPGPAPPPTPRPPMTDDNGVFDMEDLALADRRSPTPMRARPPGYPVRKSFAPRPSPLGPNR